MIMKKYLLTLSMMVLAMGAFAQQVGQEEARQRALSFLQSQRVKKVQNRNGQAVSSPDVELAYISKSKNEDSATFFVFNSTSKNGGYVIVGADQVANEILGYSENGTFDYDQIPENYKWWLSQYGMQIEDAIADVKAGRARIQSQSERAKVKRKLQGKANVPVLLTTTWDQVAPFNSQLPLYAQGFTGNYALATGCTSTAGAQVMNYFEWPESGIGSKTLNRTINGFAFSADFENTRYDWANMQDKYDYDKYTGSAQDVAVGTLMYHIGVAIDATYGQLVSGGTSAALRNLAIRLADTFKYDKGLTFEQRTYYTDEAWEEMVYAELAAKRPVLYAGQAAKGGHAFVCDGYENGRFHINWGWSGQHDGYFLLTATAIEKALTPDGSGSGGAGVGASYTGDQEIIIGVQPDYSGVSVQKKKMTSESYKLAESNVVLGSTDYIDGFVYNASLFASDFVMGVKFVNVSDPDDVVIIKSTIFSLNSNGGRSPVYFTVPTTLQVDANYYVYLVFLNENNEWTDVATPVGFIAPTIATQAPTGLALDGDLKVSNDGYISAKHCKITFDVKNWGSSTVKKDLILWVYPENGGASVDYFYLRNQEFNAGEANSYELSYSNANGKKLVENSNYFVKLQNYTDRKDLSTNVNIYFRKDISADFNMTAAGWGTICLPFEAEVPSGLTAYNVISTEGDKLIMEEAKMLKMNTPYLLSGEAGKYTFEGPDTPKGSNYRNGILVGNTAPSVEGSYVYAPQGSYVLQNNSEGLGFYKVAASDSQKIRQYSAYVHDKTYPGKLGFNLAESVTDIETIQEIAKDAPAYNLNGVRVNKNAKGFVIVNGRLIYNK